MIDQSDSELQKASAFFDQHQNLFIKAASQGSSIGCYHCTKKEDLAPMIAEAFQYSRHVLLEKGLKARELEASFFEHEGELTMAGPGEIVCPQGFYDYKEKYNPESRTQTFAKIQLDAEIVKKLWTMGERAYRGLKLRHFSRIDFFLTQDGQVFLNEINTFPGMTPISLFPKMIEEKGYLFSEVINTMIARELNL